MPKPNIEMRHLKYFIAVAEEISFRRAALRLHISQPPLTRQVQQLEDELGVDLFSRSGRGVELTRAGELFLVEAKNILALTEQAVDKVQKAGQGHIGRLDVGVYGSAILDVIPKMINAFLQVYPGVNIVLHDLNKVEQIKALREGRLTVGFNRYVWDEPDIVKECVLREPLYVACAAGGELAALNEVAITDLKKRPLILYPRVPRPGFADQVIALCHSRGFAPTIAQEVDDIVTAMALVSSGFGNAIVAESATNLRLPNMAFPALERSPETEVELYCQYMKDDKSPILKAFLDIIRTRKQPAPGTSVPVVAPSIQPMTLPPGTSRMRPQHRIRLN